MKIPAPIKTLFLDIGGVLLTDGWDHQARRRAAKKFQLEWADLESRHELNFATFEEGRLTLEVYLDRVVFHRKRPFTRAQFRRFMFAQSAPCPGMIGLATRLKIRHRLKLLVVSNEARELNSHRIRHFKLAAFVDAFVSSCFIGVRKPDAGIFRLALDLAQTPVGQVVYVENTPLFVQIAAGMGIRSILHTDYKSTRTALAACGLPDDAVAWPNSR